MKKTVIINKTVSERVCERERRWIKVTESAFKQKLLAFYFVFMCDYYKVESMVAVVRVF